MSRKSKNKKTEQELISCSSKDCNNKFRWYPGLNNSTIKPKYCRTCSNKRLLTASQGKVKRPYSKPKNNKPVIKPRKRTHWTEKPLKQMIIYVQGKIVNPYIRARDTHCFGKCISCNGSITEAGHRYPVGSRGGMRFLINNIHGQETSCNRFKSGNLDEYDKGLIARHGQKYLDKLRADEARYSRSQHKFYVFDVVEIGNTYRYLHKNKIWIFTQEEFNAYRDKIRGDN